MKKLYRILTKFALSLHSFSYKVASRLSIKVEGGIHPKHRLMDYHKFFVDNVTQDDTVLDLGCGNGALTFDVAQRAKKVVGLDMNEKEIKIADETQRILYRKGFAFIPFQRQVSV